MARCAQDGELSDFIEGLRFIRKRLKVAKRMPKARETAMGMRKAAWTDFYDVGMLIPKWKMSSGSTRYFTSIRSSRLSP